MKREEKNKKPRKEKVMEVKKIEKEWKI